MYLVSIVHLLICSEHSEQSKPTILSTKTFLSIITILTRSNRVFCVNLTFYLENISRLIICLMRSKNTNCIAVEKYSSLHPKNDKWRGDPVPQTWVHSFLVMKRKLKLSPIPSVWVSEINNTSTNAKDIKCYFKMISPFTFLVHKVFSTLPEVSLLQ